MRIPSTKLTKEMCNMAPVTLFDVTDDQNLNLPRFLCQVNSHPRWLPRRTARNQLFFLTLFEAGPQRRSNDPYKAQFP